VQQQPSFNAFVKQIILAVLALCLMGMSCSRGFIFKALNNSGQDLVIVSYDGKLAPHEFPVAAGASVDVQFPTQLSIRHSKGEWKYTLVQAGDRYAYSRMGGLRVQDIQIQADGQIYLLQPKTRNAVKQFPPQPDGYPMCPR
jgi:hypothetical protein